MSDVSPRGFALACQPAGRELLGGLIPQAAVRSLLVVPSSPHARPHLRVHDRQEYFPVEELVPEPAVETLGITILPRLPLLDVCCLHARSLQTTPQPLGHKLRPI